MKNLFITIAFLIVTSSSLRASRAFDEYITTVTSVHPDTLKALHHLSDRQKRKENVVRIIGIITAVGWAALGVTDDNHTQSVVHYALAGLTIISIISTEQNSRIRRIYINNTITDYENGTPLPPEIKRMLKKKDFK